MPRIRGPNRTPTDATGWATVIGLALAGAAGLVAGSGDWSLAVLVVVAPAFLLIATAAPERTALGLIALLPFMFYPATVGGFSVFIAVPAFGFVALVILVRERVRLHRLKGVLPSAAFALLGAIAIATAALSSDPATAFSRVVYIVLFGMFAGALALLMHSGRLTRESVVKAIVIAGALAATAVIVQFSAQFVLGKQSVIDWLQNVYPLFGGDRAAGINVFTSNWKLQGPDLLRGIFPFMTPPSAGQFLMLSMIAGVWLRRERRAASGVGSALVLALTLLIGIGLLLTFSRQAWVGAAVGLLALGLRRRPGQMFGVIGGLVILVSVVPIPGSNESFGSYLLTASDASTTSSGTRLDLWQQALDLIPSNALLGAGPGLIGTLGSGSGIFYAHNIFLDSAVELGIVGGLTLVAIFVIGLRAAWRNGSSIAFAMLSAFVVASMFDDVLLFPRNGLILAMAFALIASRPLDRIPLPAPKQPLARPLPAPAAASPTFTGWESGAAVRSLRVRR